MVLQNLDIIRHFGIKTENNLSIDFYIPEIARIFAGNIFKENNIPESGVKVVHVHPTSRWLFKCWRDEYMADVISWLAQQGLRIIVTSSSDKKEMDKAKRICLT